jgi:hypothetical protein
LRHESRGAGRGVTAVRLDGTPLALPVVPRLRDGGAHEVEVTIG